MDMNKFFNSLEKTKQAITTKASQVKCDYYVQCQQGIRESEKMDLIGLTPYRLFMEIMNHVYNNGQALNVDIEFRRNLQKRLGYKNIRNVNNIMKVLYEYDFIGKVSGNMILINPLASFKGSFTKEFSTGVDNYYTNVDRTMCNNNAMLEAYLKFNRNDITRI
jgi:hypothetical protein